MMNETPAALESPDFGPKPPTQQQLVHAKIQAKQINRLRALNGYDGTLVGKTLAEKRRIEKAKKARKHFMRQYKP